MQNRRQRTQPRIDISIADQELALTTADGEVRKFPISSSKRGIGFKEGSFKTPIGEFRICKKVGDGAPPGTVFKGRKPLADSSRVSPDDDLITSRILWLDGLGKRNANTKQRYIYIHGTNHEAEIGTPTGHGCIRMRNADVIALFDLVEVATRVTITRTTARKASGE